MKKIYAVWLAALCFGACTINITGTDTGTKTASETGTDTQTQSATFTQSATSTESATSTGTSVTQSVWISPTAEKPYLGQEPAFARGSVIVMGKGETRGVWIKAKGAKVVIEAPTLGVELYKPMPVKTAYPSANGIPTGDHLVGLVPSDGSLTEGVNYLFARLSAGRVDGPRTITLTAKVGNDETKLTVKVSKFVMPENPSVMLAVGSQNYYAVLGHCGGKWCDMGKPEGAEAFLGKKYSTLLKKHHIQPIQNWVSPLVIKAGKLDLDVGGANSFRNQVMAYAPGRVLFPVEKNATDAYLAALEATIKAENLVGRAYCYPWDEPKANERVALVALLKRIRAQAPSLLIQVTKEIDAELKPLVDIFSPVVDYMDVPGIGMPMFEAYAGKTLEPYTSCMAHSCGDPRSNDSYTTPGSDKGTPDLTLDRPSVHARAFVWLAQRYSLKGLLYYASTEMYRYVPKVDLTKDQWGFGGNGDGQLLWPLFATQDVAPTVVLMQLEEAIQDQEYLKAAGEDVKSLITNPKTWSHDYNAYQAVRDRIAASYL